MSERWMEVGCGEFGGWIRLMGCDETRWDGNVNVRGKVDLDVEI